MVQGEGDECAVVLEQRQQQVDSHGLKVCAGREGRFADVTKTGACELDRRERSNVALEGVVAELLHAALDGEGV